MSQGSDPVITPIHLQPRLQLDQLLVPASVVPGSRKGELGLLLIRRGFACFYTLTKRNFYFSQLCFSEEKCIFQPRILASCLSFGSTEKECPQTPHSQERHFCAPAVLLQKLLEQMNQITNTWIIPTPVVPRLWMHQSHLRICKQRQGLTPTHTS